jgi:hypothetical protein
MNARQRRIERRKWETVGVWKFPNQCDYKAEPSSVTPESMARINAALYPQCDVVYIRPEYKADLLSRDKTMYVQQFGRATRPHANMFPSAVSDEPEKDDFAAMEISAIEREIETVRATGDTIIGSTHGHDYELTRNKSCQVVVWIDGRRSSKNALFGIINEFHSEFK